MLLGESKHHKERHSFLDASKNVILQANEETMYVFMFCNHSAGQTHNIKIEKAAKFKHLGTSVINEKYIHEKITTY